MKTVKSSKLKVKSLKGKKPGKATTLGARADISIVPIYNSKGKEVEKFQLNKEIFSGDVNNAVLYQAVVMYNANQRRGTACTKTRGDVSGGGKKPFRQKGTGRARAGSTRSPLWRHGGTIFGPHPRDFHYALPKKIVRVALLSSINSKLNEEKLIGIDSISIADAKAKSFMGMVNALKLTGAKLLFIFDDIDDKTLRAARNIESVAMRSYREFNAMDILVSDNVVMTKKALEKLPERFKGI